MRCNLLAVSHDAGGAELLSSYLKQSSKKYGVLRCIVQGPAKRIFVNKNLQKCLIGVEKGRRLISDRQIDLLLTSTSRSTDLEIDFIKLAKKHSIATVTMMDHWINYRERFGYPFRGWRANLPDSIWVVDKLAKNIAEREFGKEIKVKVQPNHYFNDLRSEYKKTMVDKDKFFFNILFLNEPVLVRGTLRRDKIKSTEVKKVARLIGFIKTLSHGRSIRFTIRQHPIEDYSRYPSVIRDNSDNCDFIVSLSNLKSSSLVRDIKNADVVFGIRSSALAIASLFRRTISLCDEPPEWFPIYNIEHVKPDFSGLGDILKEGL